MWDSTVVVELERMEDIASWRGSLVDFVGLMDAEDFAEEDIAS